MKLTRMLFYGLLASAPLSAAATLPLDRPTPPPCCVDGICRAHAASFGYFPTRWRTWPGLGVAPMPRLQPPAVQTIPGLPTIEPPTPEQEDRRAPEPTKPAAPAPLEFAPPGATAPRTAPLDSTENRDAGGGQAAPRTGPLGLPQPVTQPFGPRPTTVPDAGGGTGPGLDFDQPPLPPSASLRGPTPPAASQTMAVSSSPLGPAAKSIPRSTVVPASATDALSPTPRRSVANDPPPPLPLALRGAAL